MTKEAKRHIPVTGSPERRGSTTLSHNGRETGLTPGDIRPDRFRGGLQTFSDGRLQREGLAHGDDPYELGDGLEEATAAGLRTTYFENPDETNLMRIYLRDINREPLLTAPEEVKLAMAYEAGVEATQTLATSNN